MLEAIATGLLALLTPQAVLFMLIGSVYGLIIGILPGLGGIVAMTLLLPFTFGYELPRRSPCCSALTSARSGAARSPASCSTCRARPRACR